MGRPNGSTGSAKFERLFVDQVHDLAAAAALARIGIRFGRRTRAVLRRLRRFRLVAVLAGMAGLRTIAVAAGGARRGRERADVAALGVLVLAGDQDALALIAGDLPAGAVRLGRHRAGQD